MFIPVCIHVLSQQNRRQLSYCKGALCINSKFSKVNTKFCKTNIFIDKTLINCLSFWTWLENIGRFFFLYILNVYTFTCVIKLTGTMLHYQQENCEKIRSALPVLSDWKNPIYYTLYQKVQCNKWIQNLKNPNRKIKWWISVLISLPFFVAFFFIEGEKTRVEWHINQLCVCGIIITFRDF